MKNMANWLIVSKNKWWTNGELTRFWKWGIHQEIELAVPIVVVWVQTSRTHLDRSSLFPSLVTPLRKLSSLLKYVPPKKTINVSLVILTRPRPRPSRFSSAFAATAFASPGHVTLIPGQNLKPQVIILQIINRDQSRGVPYFSNHIKDTNQEQRDSKRRAHERCDCHLVWRMNQVSQKVAWLIPACPKIRVSDLSFTNTQSCSERMSIDIHGMWRRHKKTTTIHTRSPQHPFHLQNLC